jgi:hypothetical protein
VHRGCQTNCKVPAPEGVQVVRFSGLPAHGPSRHPEQRSVLSRSAGQFGAAVARKTESQYR